MKALVTGIAGFAGSHLAEFLVRENNVEVFGMDLPGARDDNLGGIKDKVKIYGCDIRKASSVDKLIRNIKPDLVFHLAAQAYIPDSWILPSDSLYTNIIGTVNLLEAVRKTKRNVRIHIACSAEEYGRVYKNEIPVKESNPFRPLSPYAVGKLGQDMLGYQYSQSYGMFIVRTRAFNHCGPRMSESFVASGFAKQIALIEKQKQKPVIYVGNLESLRDFTDVRDIVKGYWLSLKKGKAGEAYNICSGKGYKVKRLLEILLAFTQGRIVIKQDKQRMRPSDIMVLVGDNSKLCRETGWYPTIPFKKTLEDLLEYWRKNV